MTPTEREARQWAAFERVVAPGSGSAESERKTAQAQLDVLRAKYPGWAPPKDRGPTVDPFSGFPGGGNPWWTSTSWEPGWGWGRHDPTYEERRRKEREDAEARQKEQRRAESVRRQRDQIERVPDWRVVEALHELHRSESEWSAEEKRRAKDLAAAQWQAVKVDFPRTLRDLSSLTEQVLSDYDKQQVRDILSELARKEGPRMHAGHERWIARRLG
jgi:hypothetical protein